MLVFTAAIARSDVLLNLSRVSFWSMAHETISS